MDRCHLSDEPLTLHSQRNRNGFSESHAAGFVVRDKCRSIFLMAMLAVSAVPLGCRGKHASLTIPGPNAEALKHMAEGDASFQKSHLYGWRQAEVSYRDAYELTASAEAKRKLLLTRFLLFIRQIDEDIPNPGADETIHELCAGDDGRENLCAIAQWYGKGKNSSRPDILTGSIFGGEYPELEAYFNYLLSNSGPLDESAPKLETLIHQFGESPLFLYLDLGKLIKRDPAEMESSYPHFAEAFEFMAESLFQKKKYRTARMYFQKAIDLIPDYTRPMNGLGNIYFFGLEDYERALRCYESALGRDPTNTAALFGKGAVLHKLGRYPESNATLDRMLATDLLRNGRITGAGYLYYSGEGNYLKAYNYFLMNEPARAREFIDAARQFQPDSEEIVELSGVLHFRAQKLEEARRDFLDVISKGNSNCNAQMNLGLVYLRMKESGVEPPPESSGKDGVKGYLETWSLRNEPAEKKSLNYFLGAGSCMESAIRYLSGQISSVPALDLEPAEKTFLQNKLQYKLKDARVTYASNIETMLEESTENLFASGTYLDLLREILARVRGQ